MTEIPQRITLEIPINQENIPAIEWLHEHTQLSKQCLKSAMSKGAVWLQKQSRVQPLRRASNHPPLGSTLYLYYDEHVLQQTSQVPTLISDKEHYSVWHKPAGMLSHGSKWGDHCSIIRWVEQHHLPQRTSFLVHRLDRATNGLMIIAHNKKTAAALSQQFEQRSTQKHYHAIVKGKFPDDQTTIDESIDGKAALSIVTLINYFAETDRSLVNIAIKTGRKHQIRRHLQQLNYPIIGDRLYGSDKHQTDSTCNIPNLQLCAYSLGIHCPIEDKPARFILPHHQHLSLN